MFSKRGLVIVLDLLPGGGNPTGVEDTEPLVLCQLPVPVLVCPDEHTTNLRKKQHIMNSKPTFCVFIYWAVSTSLSQIFHHQHLTHGHLVTSAG